MPAPYMVERFNALADRGNLEFEAWFNERAASDRSWDVEESTWRFPYRYMPSVAIGPWHLRFPLPLLARRKPDVLVSLYAEPSFLIGWLIAQVRRIPTVFRMLATSDRWVRRRWWKELIKRAIFRRVSGVETPGAQARAYASRYAAGNKIFYARHTVDIRHFRGERTNALSMRESFRATLGLRGVTFLYIGRLWWGKGLNYLLDAFAMVQSRMAPLETSLLLVGDGRDELKLRKQISRDGLKNVVFTGFKQKRDLPPYYAASDIFVFPTLGDPYGLVVDEAMASFLPIVSTSEAGEIHDRVKDGVNGYIVGPEDAEALADKMELLARSPNAWAQMGAASFEIIKDHTAEGWAADFESAIREILKR